MRINRVIPMSGGIEIKFGFISGAGSRSTISMSNTRKITARRKNRNENGVRAEFFGSNPHSNGESFSRSWLEREAKTQATRKTIDEIAVASVQIKSVRCMGLWGARRRSLG